MSNFSNEMDFYNFLLFFFSDLATTGRDNDVVNMMWIGLVRIGGNFVWTDATPLDYTNWHAGEPNNYHGDENCVQVGKSACDQGDSLH